VSRYLPQTVLSAAVPTVIVLAIIPVDPLSAGLLVFTVPVIVMLMILIGTFTREHVQRQWETLGRLSSAFLDIVQGLPTLILLDRDGGERRRVETISEQFRDRTLSVLKVAFGSGAVLELMTAAGIGLIATVLGVRLLDGSMPFDRAFFVFLLTPEFYRPLRDLGAHRHAMIEGSAAAERILEILQTPVVEAAGASQSPLATSQITDCRPRENRLHPRSVGAILRSPATATDESGIHTLVAHLRHHNGQNPPPPSPGALLSLPPHTANDSLHIGSGGSLSIELNDVSYIYPERESPALSHITLSLLPGTCTAVVGRSGSGKTTLVKLLLRAMDPTDGVVTANGIALNAMPIDVWRRHIALVPQRPYLFRGTVRENIRLARPDAGDDEVGRAAALAGCLPFIAELTAGFDTVLGEQGEGLSAGQRQRLAIARALVKDAPLLVLDEPTSALDPESEAEIRRALSVLMRDRTVLVVAHRLNTVKAAGRIAVLDAGQLAEVGSNDELLRLGGLYTALTGSRQAEAVTI
jgi:ABC-type transport system involved in cytochrome bd biosynthesis fused ATPase/permease subunit